LLSFSFCFFSSTHIDDSRYYRFGIGYRKHFTLIAWHGNLPFLPNNHFFPIFYHPFFIAASKGIKAKLKKHKLSLGGKYDFECLLPRI